MARRRTAIRSLAFRHNWKPNLGFEVFRLSELYDRAERRSIASPTSGGARSNAERCGVMIDHALETPQRPQFHTIYVGVRGEGRLIVDFTPVPLGAGYLTVVARGRVQQFVVDRSVEAWMLLFAPELLGAERAPALLSPVWAAPAIAVPPADRRELLALVDQLHAEHARDTDELQPEILAALLRALVLRGERLQAGRAAPPTAALERFFTILERDHATTRTVAHYARLAGVSPRRLGELLLEQTGKSTKQVIDERVVLEHKRLLAHTEVSVKELAERTGFAEPTNLVKFFRHHTGQTPLAFRAAHRMFLPSGRRS